MELLYDLAISLPGIFPKGPKSVSRGHICPPGFTASFFTIAKVWEKPKCLSKADCIKNMWYMYITEYYSAIERTSTVHRFM